jgi:hypothetical protein
MRSGGRHKIGQGQTFLNRRLDLRELLAGPIAVRVEFDNGDGEARAKVRFADRLVRHQEFRLRQAATMYLERVRAIHECGQLGLRTGGISENDAAGHFANGCGSTHRHH